MAEINQLETLGGLASSWPLEWVRYKIQIIFTLGSSAVFVAENFYQKSIAIGQSYFGEWRSEVNCKLRAQSIRLDVG